jgi:excisionase family DNA binding protein
MSSNVKYRQEVRVTSKFLAPQEVADGLGVDVQTVRRWIHAGRLRAFKPGKEYRIRESDLEEFLQAREVRPKGPAPSPLQPSLNGLLEEERRSGYLRAWRAFVWKLVGRWEQEPPKTSEEIVVVLDTMQALVDQGAFGEVPAEITTSDLREASEVIELQALFMGLQRLNAIADTVKGDETAQQRRELLEALPGGLSA